MIQINSRGLEMRIQLGPSISLWRKCYRWGPDSTTNMNPNCWPTNWVRVLMYSTLRHSSLSTLVILERFRCTQGSGKHNKASLMRAEAHCGGLPHRLHKRLSREKWKKAPLMHAEALSGRPPHQLRLTLSWTLDVLKKLLTMWQFPRLQVSG